ncbi:hypothetical protein PLO_0806 [Pediococcus acidilactici NGRI 0510Q]|nr:hypothetical protein PLO_0806 [Pediococcus acidilactici NGRI 0510Q]
MNEEEIRCIGCGATLQTEDAQLPGYTPASALKKRSRKRTIILSTLLPVASL